MRKPIEIFCEMSTLASHMSDCRRRGNTECLADDAQEMNRLRGEHCRARGVAEQDISPNGYDISQRAYEHVRDNWIYNLRQFDGEQFRTGAVEAHAKWLGLRPDLAEGDDWLALADEKTEV